MNEPIESLLGEDLEAAKRSLARAKRRVEREKQFNRKVELNTKVNEANRHLQRMRNQFFTAEDALNLSLESCRIELFSHYGELFPRTYKALQKQISQEKIRKPRFAAIDSWMAEKPASAW